MRNSNATQILQSRGSNSGRDSWVEQGRNAKVTKHVRKDFSFQPMSFQDEASRCLSQAIEVSRSETEVGDCIRHNTEDKGVKSCTSGRDREHGPVKRFKPIAQFSKRARVDIV